MTVDERIDRVLTVLNEATRLLLDLIAEKRAGQSGTEPTDRTGQRSSEIH